MSTNKWYSDVTSFVMVVGFVTYGVLVGMLFHENAELHWPMYVSWFLLLATFLVAFWIYFDSSQLWHYRSWNHLRKHAKTDIGSYDPYAGRLSADMFDFRFDRRAIVAAFLMLLAILLVVLEKILFP